MEQVVPGPDFTAGVKNVTVPEGRWGVEEERPEVEVGVRSGVEVGVGAGGAVVEGGVGAGVQRACPGT